MNLVKVTPVVSHTSSKTGTLVMPLHEAGASTVESDFCTVRKAFLLGGENEFAALTMRSRARARKEDRNFIMVSSYVEKLR